MTSRRLSLTKRSAPEPEPVAAEPVVAEPARGAGGGKGRPTPKRSAAQRRRGGPVAPPPANRREAAKRQRAEQAQTRRSVRAGTVAGDQTRMLPRDAGPERALVRDVVDGRRSIAVLLLPMALALFVVRFTGSTPALAAATSLWLVTLITTALDSVLIGVLVRRALRAAAGDRPVPLRGHVAYALLRSTVFRRFRMPPPRVRPRGLLPRRS